MLAQRHTHILDRGHVWVGPISAVPHKYLAEPNQRCEVQVHLAQR